MKNLSTKFAALSALCFVASTLTAETQAASFDCSKAGTKVEHIICDNPEISKLDDEMAARYRLVLETQGQAQVDAVMRAQKQWIKARNGCLDAVCLVASYQARINKLPANKVTESNSKSVTDEYVLVEQDPEQTGEYLSHIEPDPVVCKLYEDNLNYFAHQNVPMSCNRPIAPQFKDRIKEVEWEDLKPADYPELFRQVVLFSSFGYDNTPAALKKYEARLFTREYVFRRAKIELSGEPCWHGTEYGLPPPQKECFSGKFYIVQFGSNSVDTGRASSPCKPSRGNPTKHNYAYDLALYKVNAEMRAVINPLGALNGGARGENMLRIDDKFYVETNQVDASIYLFRLDLKMPVILESLCKYQFNPAQTRR